MKLKKSLSLLLLVILVSPILAGTPFIVSDGNTNTIQSSPSRTSVTAAGLSLDPVSILVYTEFADQAPGEERGHGLERRDEDLPEGDGQEEGGGDGDGVP